MKWLNLKENRCPKCGEDLSPLPHLDTLKCSKCIFAIKEARMQEIVSDMVGQKIQLDYSEERRIKQDEDNQREWNNWGREEVTNNFSIDE